MATRKPNPAEKIAIGYCRVSTDKQVRNGVSLEAQQAAIHAHCALKGLALSRIIVDPGVSAAKVPLRDRPEGAKLLADIEKGRVGVVIVYKLDRAFRNAVETLLAVEDWEKRGVALHLIDLGGMSIDTSTAMGKMFLTMLAGLAEMERNIVSERTISALAHKKAIGELTGQAPFGMRAAPSGRVRILDDGSQKPIMKLVPVPHEQAARDRILTLHAQGMSLRQIGSTLTAEGYQPRGARWHPESIRSVLGAATASCSRPMTAPPLAVAP